MKKTFALFSTIALTAIVIIACSKSERQVPVQFLLTDNPTSYDAVNVHIKGIQVKMSNDSSSWISLQSKDTTVNLLDLQNGVTMLLAQGTVPDGVLKEVRFILENDNTVVVSGTSHPLITPSAEHSGLKIKINKELNATMNTFTLDFDAALSVKEENGSYKLMPVIKVKN